MKEKLTSAINFALQNKISEMSCDVSDVMKTKIKDKIAEKKKKVAEEFMGESELSEETFKFTGYASNSPYDDKSNKHEFEVKAKNAKHANDKAIKIMHTKFPDHTHHGVKLVESRYNRDVDFDDEGWGVKNPKMPKFKYGQNNPYKAPPLAKIYHNVPFKQKEEAKAEGMKFDGDKKKWYHTNPESSKNSKFSKLEESIESIQEGKDWPSKAEWHIKSASNIANLYPKIKDGHHKLDLEKEYAMHMFGHHEAMMIHHALNDETKEAKKHSELAKQYMDAAGIPKVMKEEFETLFEKKMTSSEKSKEKKLKIKYDSSEMKQKMIDQYGPEKGKAIYFATIRKQAMKEDEEINEALSMMTLKKHYYELPSSEFKKQYGHPKHVVASIFGWS